MRLLPPVRRAAVATTATATLAALLSAAPTSAVENRPVPSDTRGVSAEAPGKSFERFMGPVSGQDRRLAARTLAEAKAFSPRPDAPEESREASILLRDLALTQSALAPEDRRLAQRVLARPTAAGGDGYLDYADNARVTSDCAVSPVADSNFCVHWARETGDAPSLVDSDGDGVPDQVEKTHEILDQVWGRIVTLGGFAAPPADTAGPSGFRERFDVYLGNIGRSRLYGYCTLEAAVNAYRGSSYCVLDDDFSTRQFGGDPLGNLQVTVAHEFFHAVQFGIDYTEDGFFMENSSTWIEDEIYDAINDNWNYFPESSLRRPGDPLDLEDNWYGNWVWLRFLTEAFPDEAGTGLPTLVKRAWDRTDNSRGSYSMRALADTVTARGGDFAELVADFATANRSPARFYEEGSAYPSAPAARTVKLGSPAKGSVTVDHLASATVRAQPASALRRGSDLRVVINAPSLPAELQVNVTRRLTDGRVLTRDLRLNASGDGKMRLPFATGDTARVDVTLVNAGRDYRCNVGGRFACQGTSRDDNRRFLYALRPLTN